jgi:hypothetical protein
MVDSRTSGRTLGHRHAVRDVVVGLSIAWQRTYDLVLCARPEPGRPIEPDGLRVVDARYQTLIEAALSTALVVLNVDLVELPHGRSDRIEFILPRLAAFRSKRDGHE